MKRAVIIGAAPIENYERVKAYLKKEDYLIFCDGGLTHRRGLEREPDLVVGDFDSYEKRDFDAKTIELPVMKDDTDTMYAAREALKLGYRDFLLLGFIGRRFDHSMANIALLNYLSGMGAKALLIDDYSEMEIISGEAFVDSSFAYFSLMALGDRAKGLCIEDALYPLKNAELTNSYAYAISNEPLPDKASRITVGEGQVLLIRVFDSYCSRLMP